MNNTNQTKKRITIKTGEYASKKGTILNESKTFYRVLLDNSPDIKRINKRDAQLIDNENESQTNQNLENLIDIMAETFGSAYSRDFYREVLIFCEGDIEKAIINLLGLVEKNQRKPKDVESKDLLSSENIPSRNQVRNESKDTRIPRNSPKTKSVKNDLDSIRAKRLEYFVKIPIGHTPEKEQSGTKNDNEVKARNVYLQPSSNSDNSNSLNRLSPNNHNSISPNARYRQTNIFSNSPNNRRTNITTDRENIQKCDLDMVLAEQLQKEERETYDYQVACNLYEEQLKADVSIIEIEEMNNYVVEDDVLEIQQQPDWTEEIYINGELPTPPINRRRNQIVFDNVPRRRNQNEVLHNNWQRNIYLQREQQSLDYEELVNLEDVKVGLSEMQLNTLPTFKLTEIKKDDKCSVCMEDHKEGQVLRRLPCFHYFHKICIDKWLSMSKKCPVCNVNVTI